MTEGSDIDKLITQLGLGWTRFAKKSTGFLKVVITHAQSGDERKTLEALSAFYEALDFRRMPGDPTHLFLSACQVLSSKHLLPSELVPLGALKGSESDGVRYLVLTAVGLSAQTMVYFYTSETKFEVGDIITKLSGDSTSALSLRVFDPQFEATAIFEASKVEAVRRLCSRLSDVSNQKGGSSTRPESTGILDQLQKAKDLRDSGALSDEEFEKIKSSILSEDY